MVLFTGLWAGELLHSHVLFVTCHTARTRDMFGACPTNAPSNCTPGPKWSPNDPLFYMHHGTIDKIWSDWQNRNPASASSFFGGSVAHHANLSDNAKYPTGGPPYLGLDSIIPTDGLFPEVTIGDVLNTTGGYLCYVYE